MRQWKWETLKICALLCAGAELRALRRAISRLQTGPAHRETEKAAQETDPPPQEQETAELCPGMLEGFSNLMRYSAGDARGRGGQ